MMSKNFEVHAKAYIGCHDKLVATLEKQIADKDAQIQQQADIIASLQKVIDNLRSMSSSADIENTSATIHSPSVLPTNQSPRAEV